MTIKQDRLLIKSFMHEGNKIPCNIMINTADIKENPQLAGALSVENFPMACPRCARTKVYLVPDGDNYNVFCSNLSMPKNQDSCGARQSNATKAKSREENSKNQEMQNGMIVSGARKFAMGKDYFNASFNSWNTPSNRMTAVAHWFTNNKPFLVCLGTPGTAKTYMCACILNRLFNEKKDVYYTTHRRFISELQKAINDGDSVDNVILKFFNKDYLIIDDLGSATNTDWQKEKILDLIDYRHAHQKKTVITSNFDQDEISSFLSIRTYSRLLDQKNEIIECFEADRRLMEEYSNQDVGF